MSESTRTSRAPAEKRLTYQQWKRRKMLRLARNWVLFLAGCAAVVALLTGGILWLLPKVHGLLAGPKVFAASVYDGTDYVFDAADARLVLVNANLPYTAEPAPLLDTADEVTGQQLEAVSTSSSWTPLIRLHRNRSTRSARRGFAKPEGNYSRSNFIVKLL